MARFRFLFALVFLLPAAAGQDEIEIPRAAPVAEGEAFEMAEQATHDENVKSGGMRGESGTTRHIDRSTAWTARFVRVTPQASFADFAWTERVADGPDAQEAKRSERKIDHSRGVAMIRMREGFIAGFHRIVPDDESRFPTYFNLLRSVERLVGGRKLAVGSEVTGAAGLVDALARVSFQRTPERLARETEPKIDQTAACRLKETGGDVATFEISLSRRRAGRIGSIEETSKGLFRIDLKTGRAVAFEVESRVVVKEDRFYETVDGEWKAKTSLAVRPSAVADSEETCSPGVKIAKGDKMRVTRFRTVPAAFVERRIPGLLDRMPALGELLRRSAATPMIEFDQEYVEEEGEVRARRRYVRCGVPVPDEMRSHAERLRISFTPGTMPPWLVAVDPLYRVDCRLEGEEFKLSVPDGEPAEGDEKLAKVLGRDDKLLQWLPERPVRVGEFWDAAGAKLDGDPGKAYAMLVAVVKSGGRNEAHVGVFGDPVPTWEGESDPASIAWTDIIVDLDAKKLLGVRRETEGGAVAYATWYTRLSRIMWNAPTARTFFGQKLAAQIASARSHEFAEDELTPLRAVASELLARPDVFEGELAALLQLFLDAGDGQSAIAVAGHLYDLHPSHERMGLAFRAAYMAKSWDLMGRWGTFFATKYPERPEPYLYQAMPKVKSRDFKGAIGFLEAARAKGEKLPEAKEVKAQVRYWHALALLNLGELEPSREALYEALEFVPKGPAKQEMLDLLTDMMQAEKLGVYIAFNAPEFLPLGLYHLMSERNGPLPPFADLHLINTTNEDKILVVSTEVVDVTYVSLDQIVLPGRRMGKAGKVEAPFNMRVYQTPPLRKDFDVNSISEEIERPLRIVVKEKTSQTERVILERTIPVALWPRSRMIWGRLDKEITGTWIRMERAVAAWVTPRSPFVEKLIMDAKKALPKGVEMLGGAAISEFSARDQVRAFYDYLKARGTSYVGYTSGWERGCFFQDVRVPGHVMRTTNSLCIEGTVLFATVMEGIGLKPVIVMVPGHAFVGWHDPDGPVQFKGSRLYMLETTSIGRHDFETALQFAQDHFERQRKFIERGNEWNNQVLDISALRAKGYKPQPHPD